ncbi:MAG: rhodanese-like domain-containing protein [Deltaproteobacteria bacterium]|nr:rhodanese-like domain-containing protein [Deltaproteobacteria bacterium]
MNRALNAGKALLALLLLSLFSAAAPALAPGSDMRGWRGQAYAGGHTVITGTELQAMMKDAKGLVIVDVREPELYSKGHVPGSINIPYDTAKPRIIKELNRKDTIVFICHGGPMGDELGEVLTKNGYGKVYNVKGGMNRWTGPVVAGAK